MSRIICQTHGRQVAVEVCHHLYEALTRRQFLQASLVKSVKVRYDDLDPELNDLTDYTVHYFCHHCAKQYDLPLNKPLQSGERESLYQEAFQKTARVCVKCLEEHLVD
ncbi:MAG: hypothetical protein BWK78_08885 [Thiotrichaceae bacterium IS1]|nr:MAG: hypothetical protein BWK78_08885 [Thiotrichaceae bacterium IS1]